MSTAIEKGIEEAADVAKHYLDKLVAPGLEESGGLIKDTVAFWRFKNKVNLVLKAKAFLEDKGIDPRRVLPKTVAPILEGGSLESEDGMRVRWAAMLANAADPSRHEVHPSFPHMLAELTPLEVRILDHAFKNGDNSKGVFPLDRDAVASEFEVHSEELQVLIDNLGRLNLFTRPLGIIPSLSRGQIDDGSYRGPVYLTSLGYDFIQACTRD